MSDRKEALRQAQELLNSGRLDEAAEAFEQLLYDAPNDLTSLVSVARLALALEQSEEALLFSQKAFELDPESREVRIIRALALEQNEGPQSAAAEMGQISDREPQHFEAGYEAARLYHLCDTEDDFRKAAKYIKRALATNTFDVDAQFLCGIIYRKLGGFRESVEAFNTAMALSPQRLEIYTELTDMLSELGEFDTALAVLNEARRCCGRSLEISTRQSGLHALKGDWDRVVFMCERITKELPDSLQAWLNLGQAYTMVGQLDDAEKAFLEGIQIAPKDWEPFYMLGNLYEACELMDKAKEALRQSITFHQERWEPLNNLGRLLIAGDDTKDNQEGLAMLEQACSLGPKASAPRLNLTLAFLKSKQTHRAYSVFQELLGMESLPDDVAEQVERLKTEFASIQTENANSEL